MIGEDQFCDWPPGIDTNPWPPWTITNEDDWGF